MSLGGLSDTEIQVLEDRLLASVREYGGTAGNVSLMRELDWPDNQYWSVRNRLVDSGALILGRGRITRRPSNGLTKKRGGTESVSSLSESLKRTTRGRNASKQHIENHRPTLSMTSSPFSFLRGQKTNSCNGFGKSLYETSLNGHARQHLAAHVSKLDPIVPESH